MNCRAATHSGGKAKVFGSLSWDQTRAMRGFLVLALAACVCLLTTCFPYVAAQMTNPLMGQGIPPKDPVDVYVSTLLEKLISGKAGLVVTIM